MANVRKSSLILGIILVVVGGLLMLNAAGILAINLWKLVFPTILVLAGLWILAGKAVAPGITSSVKSERIALDGAARASVRLHLAAGEMHATGGAADGELVESSLAGGLEADLQRDGEALDVSLQPAPTMWLHMLNPLNWGGHKLVWRAAFNETVPLALSVETWASAAQLDLASLHIPNIDLRTTMGDTRVTLPASAGHTATSVQAVLGEVRVVIPRDVAARIEASSELGEVSVDERRFPRSGFAYQSPDFDTAEHKVEIAAGTVLGEIRIY